MLFGIQLKANKKKLTSGKRLRTPDEFTEGKKKESAKLCLLLQPQQFLMHHISEIWLQFKKQKHKNDVGAEEAMTPKLKHHHHQIRPGIFVRVRSRLQCDPVAGSFFYFLKKFEKTSVHHGTTKKRPLTN